MDVSALELAWAAGFFDGEGWVGATMRRDRPNGRPQLKVMVPQVHTEVLERFQSALGGAGRIIGPIPPKQEGWSDQWRFEVNGWAAREAMLTLLPYLSSRKREQANAALAAFDEVTEDHRYGPRVTHCPNGHEYTEENTYQPPSGSRRCRACHRKPYRNQARVDRRAA